MPREILEPLQRWGESLSSVYLVCEWTFDRDTPAARDPSAPPPEVEVSMRLEWAWTDRGQLRYNRGDRTDGVVGARQLWTIDGDRAYTLEFADDNPDAAQPQHVTIHPAPSGSSLVVEPLYGLWYANHSQWLPDLAAEGKVRMQLPAEGDALEHPVVRVERAPNIFLSLTLDPRHGMLPSRVVEGEGDAFQLVVHEYRSVGPELWFPGSGVFETFSGGDLKLFPVESCTAANAGRSSKCGSMNP